MRILPRTVPVDAHRLQHVAGLLPGLLLRAVLVQEDHLTDLISHGLHRIQRGHRILEDHGNLFAADGTHLAFAQREEVPALEIHLAAQHLGRRVRQDPEDTQRRRGLARTGFTHKAQRFALAHLQVKIIDRVDAAAAGAVFHREVFYP